MTLADLAFYAFSTVTVAAALMVTLSRNPVHSVLWLILTFLSAAGLFVLLGAEFVAMLLIIVYVGAVAILIVFAILLTRSTEPKDEPATVTPWIGIAVAVGAFLTMAAAVLASPVGTRLAAPAPEVSVRTLGQKLMTDYVLPLEVMAKMSAGAKLAVSIEPEGGSKSPDGPSGPVIGLGELSRL